MPDTIYEPQAPACSLARAIEYKHREKSHVGIGL